MLPQRRGDLVNECLAGNKVELNDCLMYFSILPTNLTSKDFFALIYSFTHLFIYSLILEGGDVGCVSFKPERWEW